MMVNDRVSSSMVLELNTDDSFIAGNATVLYLTHSTWFPPYIRVHPRYVRIMFLRLLSRSISAHWLGLVLHCVTLRVVPGLLRDVLPKIRDRALWVR